MIRSHFLRLPHLLAFVCLPFSPAAACDYCGCFIGITPYDNQSSVGLDYRYKSYNGYASMDQPHQVFPDGSFLRNPNAQGSNQVLHNTGSGEELSAGEYEIYRTAELRGKYFIHHRVECNAFLPYRWNKHVHPEDGEYQSGNGLGDLTLLAGYHLVSRPDAEVMPQRLVLGGGIKLPTGKDDLDEDGLRLDHELQPGTGSTDYVAYLSYAAGYNHFGLNISCMFRVNGSNRFDEKVSDNTNAQGQLFYKFKKKDWYLIPSLQGYYEYTNGLTVNREQVSGTGANLLMAGAGLDVYYKRTGLKLSIQLPVMEKQAGGTESPAAASLICAGLVFNFNQLTYLLGHSGQ
jgi:hypothetical protein